MDIEPQPICDIKPFIIWKHIDGPYIICSDDTIHWLSWIDRFLLEMDCINMETLDDYYMSIHNQSTWDCIKIYTSKLISQYTD